jgi:hypothetical protein
MGKSMGKSMGRWWEYHDHHRMWKYREEKKRLVWNIITII